MSIAFNPAGSIIPVAVQLAGPGGIATATLVLDTGATWTIIARDVALRLGYDPDAATARAQIITASGRESSPVITVQRITAIDTEMRDFQILCHTLPAGSPVDGLLGLDFFRGQKLTLDFRAGLVTLE